VIRLLSIPLLAFSLLLAGCGQIYVAGFWNQPAPPPHPAPFKGTVAAVEIRLSGDFETPKSFTVVTLRNSNGFTTLNFCGSHASEFPVDGVVSVRFSPESECARLRSVQVAEKRSGP
jgi:hypothetical protein